MVESQHADWVAKLLNMLWMQATFSLVYLPASVVAFTYLSSALYGLLTETSKDCVLAALLDAPRNLWLTGPQHLAASLVASEALWLPGHTVSYVVVYRWCPEARTAVDGIFALTYNLYLWLGHRPGRSAVGPLLITSAPSLAAQNGHGPAVDCERWNLRSVAERWIVQPIFGLCALMLTAVKCVWFLLCSLLRSTYVATMLVLWAAVFLPWKLLGAPFVLWDKIKGFVLLGFIPGFFPYNLEPYALLWPLASDNRTNGTSGNVLCCSPFAW